MMNKKAQSSGGIGPIAGQIAKIVVSVIALLILFYLAYLIYNFYSDRTDVQRSESELNEMYAMLQQVTETGEEKDYFITYAPNWYLFSSEFPDLCEGKFCLCICEEIDCGEESTRSCITTEKFVLLRKNNKETRLIQLESPPSKMRLKFIEENAYPFNFGEPVENRGWGSIMTTTPLFFKFATEWIWSPDLQNWMSSSQLEVTGGSWAGAKPTQKNQDFLNDHLSPIKNSHSEGDNLFYRFDAKISEGVYIIEK